MLHTVSRACAKHRDRPSRQPIPAAEQEHACGIRTGTGADPHERRIAIDTRACDLSMEHTATPLRALRALRSYHRVPLQQYCWCNTIAAGQAAAPPKP